MTRKFTTYALALTGLAAVALLVGAAGSVSGPVETAEAQAQSCSTTTISSDSLSSAQVAGPQNTAVNQESTNTQNINDEVSVGSDEYISSVTLSGGSLSAGLSRTCSGGGTGFDGGGETGGGGVDCESVNTIAQASLTLQSGSKTDAFFVTHSDQNGEGTSRNDSSLTLNLLPEDKNNPVTLTPRSYAAINTISQQAEITNSVNANTSAGDLTVEVCDLPVENNAPVAVNDGADEGAYAAVCSPAGATLSIDVLGNDGDPDGDTISIQSVQSGSKGTTAVSGNRVLYSAIATAPDSGFSDSFEYTITDGEETDTAEVSVQIQKECQEGKVTLNAGAGGGNAQITKLLYDLDANQTNGIEEIYSYDPQTDTSELADGVTSEGPLNLNDGPATLNLPISQQPRRFEIPPGPEGRYSESIEPALGYRLTDQNTFDNEGNVEPIPVKKNPSGDANYTDVTGQEYSAQLGLDFDDCTPNGPVSVDPSGITTIASQQNDLIVGGDYGPDGCAAIANTRDNAHANISGADWIWETARVADPTVKDTATFQKQFDVVDKSDIQRISLQFGVDNYYTVSLNGNQLASTNPGNDNPATGEDCETTTGQDACSFAEPVNVDTAAILPFVNDGRNTLEVEVTNEANQDAADSTSQNPNPAGVAYRIEVDTTEPTPSVNQAPNASGYAAPKDTSGSRHTYTMNAENSSDADGSIVSYQWEVIDVKSTAPGQPLTVFDPLASGEITDMFFSNPRDDTTRTYTVQLTVTDDDGATDTTNTYVSVTCNYPEFGGGGACVTQNDGSGGIDQQ